MALLTERASRSGRPVRRFRLGAGLGLAIGLFLLGGARLSADTVETGEYRLKAVFVLNFIHFVQWPPGSLPPGSAPLVIGVLGSDPFGVLLDEAVRGEKQADHPLVVRRFRRIEDVADCQILFISQSESLGLRRILDGLKGRSILTVGDADGFSERGGMISFVTENRKIRLKINVEAARAAALTIDARLLRPARLVVTERTD